MRNLVGILHSSARRAMALGVLSASLVGLVGLGTAVSTVAAPAASATPAPLLIITGSVPNATKGQPYPATTLVATGGTQPYHWSSSVAFQGIPPGLSLSDQGVISGTPTVAGSFVFRVNVSDSGSPAQTEFNFLTITVAQGPAFDPGSVLAWGYDPGGELGNPAFISGTGRFRRGYNVNAPNPVTLPPSTVTTAISAGAGTGYALTTTGHVYAWGYNNAGQLGVNQTFGTLRFSASPVEVCAVGGCGNGPLSDIVAISGGGSYALALTSSGQVVGWGLDNTGQLGDAARPGSQSNIPIPVCEVGGCDNGQLSGIKAVAAGASGTSLALTTSGTVLAWGNNSNGQVGNGTTGPFFGIHIPQPVCAPGGCTAGNLTGIAAISAGAGDNEMALTTSGAALAWGANSAGQLGNGTQTDAPLPTQVSIPASDTVSAISAGAFGALALTTTGTVLSWGSVNGGTLRQPGLGNGDVNGSTTPVALSLPPIAAIAAGDFANSMVLTTAGQVLTWGNNGSGQLGQDNGYGGQSLTPVPPAMPADTVVTAVSSGSLFNMALVGANTTVTGRHRGSLTIGPGSTLISGATVTGPVVVSPGAAVVITDSHFDGALTSNGAASLSICDSRVNGSLSVTNSIGLVYIGDAGDDGSDCGPNTVHGSLSLTNNGGGYELGGNTVTGSTALTNNVGTGPGPENSTPELEANHIGGTLSCSANSPAPVADGQPNVIAGLVSPQCPGLT